MFLAGRTQATLDGAADALPANDGTVDTAVVDALDETAIDAHAADVVNVAAFVASDLAATITGAAIDISCGAMFD